MCKNNFLKHLCMVLMLLTTVTAAQALSLSNYASTSKLANGKWVKIQIPESGVYELTAAELSEMGFADITKVRIYGNGGYMMSEVLDGSAPDDLVQVPLKRYGNKICFYAKGPVSFTLESPTGATPRFTRTVNAYSQYGYYFVTENIGNDLTINSSSAAGYDGSVARPSSLAKCYHELEKTSVKLSGKSYLGEAIPTPDMLTLPYSVPNRVAETPIIITACVAAAVQSSTSVPVPGYMSVYLNSGTERDTLPYSLSVSRIYGLSGQIAYNYVTPTISITPKRTADNGTIDFNAYCPSGGTVTSAYLDYFIFTYDRRNVMDADNQFLMNFNQMTINDRVEMPEATQDLEVWNIDNESVPVQYPCAQYTGDGTPVMAFTPGYNKKWSQFVAFYPQQTLKKISSYEMVENQNLHGMTTPDMLILTDKVFLEQAERIAQLHRDHDNMSVSIVTQDQVFNEFSGGVPDAMAVKLMNKMFYDRNKTKFKHFLILGCGSYDNRGLIANKPNRVITYQSDNSNDGSRTYTCDDFFGFLDDNSGHEANSDLLRIGVGRIPSADPAEAKTDIDKLINYVTNPDYGSWRNNTLITADDYNSGLHTFQGDAAADLIDTGLGLELNVDKVFVEMYPRATEASEPGVAESKRTSLVGREKMKEGWLRGLYFTSYVGHSGTTYFTKEAKLWNVSDVYSTNNRYLPIMSTASCDVAQYDSDLRGIAEHMFHKTDGGAIALFTSTRLVTAEENDPLNRAFIRNLFSYAANGYMPTIGEAYMKAKQYKGTVANNNKMSFCLLGDPAIKINYPKPYFKVVSINSTDVTGTESAAVEVAPLTKLTVKAQVMNAAGTAVNTAFNGDATLSLYDVKKYFKSYTFSEDQVSKTRDIYYPRDLLAEVSGRVVNGVFTGSVVVPRNVKAQSETGLVRVYAHQDDSEEMVNGSSAKVMLLAYNEETAGADESAPVITSMYFNDEMTFSEGASVPANSILYITVDDNLGVNTQSVSMAGTMSLVMDGGKLSYPEIKSFAKMTNEGKSLSIAFPINDMGDGQHMLTYTVYDVAGNCATRTITFVVESNAKVNLEVAETPVVSKATFNMTSELRVTPPITLKVTDATGNLLFVKKVSSFPYQWDLKDNNGNKVPSGLYRYFGSYNDEAGNYGGTEIKNLVVVDILNSNN